MHSLTNTLCCFILVGAPESFPVPEAVAIGCVLYLSVNGVCPLHGVAGYAVHRAMYRLIIRPIGLYLSATSTANLSVRLSHFVTFIYNFN